MGMTYESQRYQTVDNFRVEAVERAYLFREEKLYKRHAPWAVEEGFKYSSASLPKGSFASVDEALAAVKEKLDGS